MRQPPAALSLPWTLHVQLHTEVGVPRGINDVDTVIIPFVAVFFARMVIPRSFSKSLESSRALGFRHESRTYRIVGAACYQGGFTMVYVRDDGDITQFSITTLPQALEIARYCTRINRLQNRITNILRKQVLQSPFVMLSRSIKRVIQRSLHQYGA